VNVLPKREELTGRWRKLHDAKFHYLYSCLDAIRVFESMSMISADRAVRVGPKSNDGTA
jgi:hypothetical protein